MEFRLFGPMEVDDDAGERVDLGTRKQRAVLAMLALEPGRIVPLDRLIDELWAGEGPATATGTLQSYISHLRRVLEPGRKPRTPPKLLLTREPGYLLDVAPGQVDLARFAAWAEEGRRAVRRGDHAEAREVLDRALGLWRGDPLAEFPDLEFAQPFVARLAEVRLGAIEDRFETRLSLGEAAACVPDLEGLVEAHPYRERGWGLLVLALYRAGRQADALAALRRVRALLLDDLGLEPGPDLRRLEQAVLDQADELEAPRHAEPPRAAEPVLGAGLVDRDEQLHLVGERLAEARRGSGGAVLITGEAGIGKTRLAQAAADEAAARGFRVAWGRCLDGPAPAFWPWIQAGLITEAAAELFDLYDGVVSALREGPFLLVLDDLHWADVSSLRLLAHLAGELARLPAVVVVTVRTEPGRHEEELRETLAALARQPATARAALAPFDAVAVSAFLRLRQVEASAPALLERSGGNPFYLTELLRLPAHERDEVPEGARDVIDRRVARLPEDTQALLRAAAVAGRDVDADLLAAVADSPLEEVMSQLEPAVATGLLAEPPAGADYRFSHALVRQALEAGLGRLQRARLHLRIGEYLEAQPQADPFALAAHFSAAARVGGAAKAATYAADAARLATNRLGYTEAVEQWEAALTHLPPGDSAERCRALAELGQARRTIGDAAGAMRDLTEAIGQAERLGDREALIGAVTVFGGLSVWNWRPYGIVDAPMVATVEGLLDGELADRDRAALLGTLGLELHYGPRRAEGERLALEAVELARGLDEPALLAQTLSNYLLASFVPGNNAVRLRAAEEMTAIPGLPKAARLVGGVFRLSCLLRAGELAEWKRELATCERLLAEMHRPELETLLRVAETGRLTLEGRWDEAEDMASRFPKPTFGSSLWGIEARRLSLTYTCRRGQGRVAEIADELEAAGEEPQMLPIRPLAVLAALDLGQDERARAMLERWGADLRLDWAADFAIPMWGQVAARLGAPDPAELYERLLPQADLLTVVGTGSSAWGCGHHVLAELAFRLGRTDLGREHARAAVARHEELGLSYWAEQSAKLLQ